MRICFISRRFFPAISGMSVYALNLLKELVARGHDVTMVSQYRDDEAGAAVYGGGPPPPVPGVRVIGLPSLGEQDVASGQPADFERDIEAIVTAIEDAHDERPFNLIHAQYGYPTGLAALEAARRLGLPNVVSIQGGDGHWVGSCCRTHKLAMQAVLDHAGELLIGSRSFADEVCENNGTDPARFTIVPGATDISRFKPADGKAPGELSDVPTLIYHGRVDLRKGLGELLDALPAIAAAVRPLKVIVSGIGPDVEHVRARVDAEGLGGLVEMTGYASYDDAPAVYHRGDIFVSPTYSEGFSNTILEAMASGLPVVSTDTVGVVDCLVHEENGLLVPLRDSAGLAEAVIRMLRDEELRTRVAATALQQVHDRWSWGPVATLIEEAYHRAAGGGLDESWVRLYDPADVNVKTADPNCRFRAAPHLL